MPPVRARKPTGSGFYGQADPSPTPRSSEPAKPVSGKGRPGIVHTSVYLPEALYEGLVAAFREKRKIHDIVLEGIEMALRKRERRK
jgi:hypothetical protein